MASSLARALTAGLAHGAVYAFLALGFTAVAALTRALNLAHGELVVLGGYVAYQASRALGWPLPFLLPLAAGALLPLGLLWRVLLARVRGPVELGSLVLTFGLSLALQTAIRAVWSADYRLLAPEGIGPSPWLLGLSPVRAGAAVAGTVGLLGLHGLLQRTTWGTAVRATSRDVEAAQLLGVNTDRVATATFATAAALAGVGGVLFASFHYLHPAAGVELTLLAIVLAILAEGWARPVPALLLSGMGLGVTESLVILWAGPAWRELVVALGLIGVLVARGPHLVRRE